jgi:prepilin-type processing-associated H-X9-DG protein
VFIKDTQILGISPSDLLVLDDEHPNSINDAALAEQMAASPLETYFVDVPGKTHGGTSCGFSFADGHAEIHAWRDPGTIPNIIWAADEEPDIGGQLTSVPKDPDILWLDSHISCLAPNAPAGTYVP